MFSLKSHIPKYYLQSESYNSSLPCFPWDLNAAPVLQGVTDVGGISESRFSENSEFVNPEMRKTLSFPFQKER